MHSTTTLFFHTLTFAALVLSVVAQSQTFIDDFVSSLDGQNLTALTNVIQQVQNDPGEVEFFLSLSNTDEPKTFFAPNNDALQEQLLKNEDTTFLGALLLYHLVPGTWTQSDLGTGPNHSILTTELTGHSLSFLEADRPQVFACGVPGNSGIGIYNQADQTSVLSTVSFQGITIHTINHIIKFPGPYTSLMTLLGMNEFLKLQQSAGASDSYMDNARGYTVFAFSDSAYQDATSQISNVGPQAISNNHIITGQTVWYSTFTSANYTSASGHPLIFTLANSGDYVVTIGVSSATIVRSDILTNNGVIHQIDGVLWDTTVSTIESSSTSIISSSTTIESLSMTIESSSTIILPSATETESDPKPSSSSGTTNTFSQVTRPPSIAMIAGIAVGILGVLSVILGLVLWKRRPLRPRNPEMGGSESRETITDSYGYGGLSSNTLGGDTGTGSGTAHVVAQNHLRPMHNRNASSSGCLSQNNGNDDVSHARSALSSAYTTPIVEEKGRAPLTVLTYDRPGTRSSTSQLEQGTRATESLQVDPSTDDRPQTTSRAYADLPESVVDRLLERITARIDRGGDHHPSRYDEEPPTYRGSSAD